MNEAVQKLTAANDELAAADSLLERLPEGDPARAKILTRKQAVAAALAAFQDKSESAVVAEKQAEQAVHGVQLWTGFWIGKREIRRQAYLARRANRCLNTRLKYKLADRSSKAAARRLAKAKKWVVTAQTVAEDSAKVFDTACTNLDAVLQAAV
jgi:hypothetical protein